MKNRSKWMGSWLAVLVLAVAAPALADHHKGHGKRDGQTGQPGAAGQNQGPSPEQRAKMATAHEQMAACLRSTRSMSDCHRDMRSAHEAACQNGGCGMHHGKGGHHGGGGDHGHHADDDHDHGNPGAAAGSSTTPAK